MKKRNMFPLLAVAVLLTAGLAHAQLGTTGAMKVSVPFDFTVGGTAFPAGEYTVRATAFEGVVAVVGSDSQVKVVTTHRVELSEPCGETKLVFHRYGDRYFLSQMWVQGDARGRELPPTRLEKELMSKAGAQSRVVIARK